MPWKAFLRLFIALSVTSVCRLQNLNRAECVKVEPDNKFPFNFLPESLKCYEPAWKNAVHTITNFTNGCLQKHFFNQSKHPCEKPVITIAFPLISDNPRIPLQVLPRPYLATKKDSSCTDNQVLCALGQIWKLFVFCLMAAAISGIIIWFLDHKINSGHFPKSFWSGSREGLWWAIVTMTTVGYGDRTPKSLLGRVYASLWMIVGMLLTSCITAQISSTMTTDDLRPLDDKFGQNIGVPHGSKKFFEPLCPGAKLKENSTEASLLSSLQDGEVDKIYLFDCKENEETRDLKIVHVLYTQPVIGAEVQLVGEMNNRKVKITFNKCLKQWADEYEDDDVYLERVARKILKEERWESKIPEDEEEQRHCIERHRLGRYRHDDELTATQLGLIDILLCTVAGLLITLLTTGAVWDTCLKLRHKKKSLDNNADIEKAAGTQELQSTTTILN